MPNRQFLHPIPFLEDPASKWAWTLEESLAYTRWLATGHYENFHVVSLLLPKELHQDFYNVYAYCRWSDDLGDETGNPERSLQLLAWWRQELEALYAGHPPSHPVFVALRQTISRRDLPIEPFTKLLDAFVQDQTVIRYEDWEALYGYCEGSANPVGRLVLMLCGYRDEERFRYSDAVCTGLQLANFWQDVSVDLEKGRIYLPLFLIRKHGYTEEELVSRVDRPAFRNAMREAVAKAQSCFDEGKPLIGMLDRRLALDIDLFIRGGEAILQEVIRMDYAVIARRPKIGKFRRVGILAGALATHAARLLW